MTTFHGSHKGKVKIVDTGFTIRDLTPYIVDIEGLPGETIMPDVRSFNDAGPKKVKGPPEDTVITLNLKWSRDANVGPGVVLEALRTHTLTTGFYYGPIGTDTGDFAYTCFVWVRSFNIVQRTREHIRAICLLEVDGAITAQALVAGI